ncbi:MAG: DMT family transporter [Rhodobacteraceae bacterium]|nr:MAG: DMT family transporter [Paracoccaceae bacterium]
MAQNLTSHRPGLAVSLKLAAIFLFVVLGALVKATADEVPPGQAVFFRAAFAIPVILVWLALRGQLRQGLITTRPGYHVIRGIMGTTAMGLTFTGLGLLPLPEVTAIGFATPLFTVILAALLLGERIRLIRVSAVLIGLVGVTIMLWPRLSGTGDLQDGAAMGALFILGATVLRSFVQIHVRRMVETEHTAAIVFYFSLTAAGLSLVTVPFGWVMPSAQALGLLVCAGILGGLGQILITSAYRFGGASLLAPYEYASMIFAVVIGYVWFGETPTLVMLAGAGLVIAGGGLVIWRERQLGMERAKTRAVSDPKAG